MKRPSLLLPLVLVSCACPPEKPVTPVTPKVVEAPPPAPPDAGPPQPTPEQKLTAEAKQFVATLEPTLRKLLVDASVAEWANETDITAEHGAAAAKANQAQSEGVTALIKTAQKYAPVASSLDPLEARQLLLLKFLAQPAPEDPKLSAELAQVAEDMTSIYGRGVCTTKAGKPAPAQSCKIVDDYAKVLETSHNPAELIAAWKTWHDAVGHAERDRVRALRPARQPGRAGDRLRQCRAISGAAATTCRRMRSRPTSTGCGTRSSRCTRSCIATRVASSTSATATRSCPKTGPIPTQAARQHVGAGVDGVLRRRRAVSRRRGDRRHARAREEVPGQARPDRERARLGADRRELLHVARAWTRYPTRSGSARCS